MITRTLLAAATLTLLSACQTPPASMATTAPAPAAAAAPAWQQGRTPEQAGSTLAPLAGKLTVTPAADIPIQNFRLPPVIVL